MMHPTCTERLGKYMLGFTKWVSCLYICNITTEEREMDTKFPVVANDTPYVFLVDQF